MAAYMRSILLDHLSRLKCTPVGARRHGRLASSRARALRGSAEITLAMPSQDTVHEFGDRIERRNSCLAMRRVSRAFNDCDVHRAVTLGFGNLDLPQGAVLILRALHDLHGNTDVGQVFGDVPVAELRIEPGAVPGVERVVDVVVPACELFLQPAGFVFALDAFDRGYGDILDDEVRRDQAQSPHPMVLDAARIDRGNRSAV